MALTLFGVYEALVVCLALDVPQGQSKATSEEFGSDDGFGTLRDTPELAGP